MNLHPTTISTNAFTYVAAERIFAGEASSLPAPSRVYDDACDTGYTLVSAKAGSEIIIAAHNDVRDNEGDLLYTDYRPIKRDWADRFTVRIFND
jgi:hypothetical protein